MIGLVPQELTTDAFETVVGDGLASAAACSASAPNPALHREGAAGAVAVGQEGQQDHDAVGRHEAARADRQGAVARAARSCSSTSRPPASTSSCASDMWEVVRELRAIGRHHHPDHALHRGGRGDGRPHRRHQQGRAHPGRGQGRADAASSARSSSRLQLHEPLAAIPPGLDRHRARAVADGRELVYTYDAQRGAHRHHAAAQRHAGEPASASRDLHTTQSSLEDIFVNLVQERDNEPATRSARSTRFEMARTWRTLMQSIVSPVLSTSLYFVVFGAAIGSRIAQIDGVSYGAFIVPGLIMLSLLTQSISNASFGIYFPRFTGTIYELLSAPDLAASRSCSATSARRRRSRSSSGSSSSPRRALFVPLQIAHPVWMLGLPGADRGHLQPVRLHHRHLGRRLREAAGRSRC